MVTRLHSSTLPTLTPIHPHLQIPCKIKKRSVTQNEQCHRHFPPHIWGFNTMQEYNFKMYFKFSNTFQCKKMIQNLSKVKWRWSTSFLRNNLTVLLVASGQLIFFHLVKTYRRLLNNLNTNTFIDTNIYRQYCSLSNVDIIKKPRHFM